MLNRPWLSVLMPTFNGAAFLSTALDSIVFQADPDIECIAVDDGSTDSTLSILEAYQRGLPLIVEQRPRTGNWVKNTNFALSIARGDYVCFLHQDDLWLRSRSSTVKALAIKYPEVVLFLNSSYFIDVAGTTIGKWRCPLPSLPNILQPDFVIERLLVQNFIAIPAPIFKRADALIVGGMDESLWYTADWDFWLSLVARGPSLYDARPLTGFRIHPESQTVTRSAWARDFQRQHQATAQKHLARWQASHGQFTRVGRISRFSIAVNTALAAALHGERTCLFRLLVSFLGLGPLDGYRYLRDSRIWERVCARVRGRLVRSAR